MSAHNEEPTDGLAPGTDAAPRSERHPPRTKAGIAWISVAIAALLTLALIVFLAQNTRRVEISFLWMEGTTSLAVALLIAAVAGTLITLVVGTTRIVQLRRYARRNG